jgi:VIT1/CCC1 family predicted Fe2+/Mn2+ transporter
MPAPRLPSAADHVVHRYRRVGWLRAAILGADDGIVSTSAIMIGVAAASGGRNAIAIAGLAGLVAGAMSMAAGEFVSVSSQRDTEQADIAREIREQATHPELELAELTDIYVARGLEPDFAREVARRLQSADALGSHLRDELGMAEETRARPVQAALVSAASFALAGLIPLLAMLAAPAGARVAVVVAVALVLLATLGGVGARLGGASLGRGALRVVVGGGLAMAVTALVGQLFGGVF